MTRKNNVCSHIDSPQNGKSNLTRFTCPPSPPSDSRASRLDTRGEKKFASSRILGATRQMALMRESHYTTIVFAWGARTVSISENGHYIHPCTYVVVKQQLVLRQWSLQSVDLQCRTVVYNVDEYCRLYIYNLYHSYLYIQEIINVNY